MIKTLKINILIDNISIKLIEGSQIDYVKQFAFFFIMLPTKIGLQFSVSPYTWGFELTIYHTIFYFVLMTTFTFWGFLKWGNNLAR